MSTAELDTINPADALRMLRTMRVARQMSQRIAKLYPTDVMETPVHLCIGQEAVSAGLCCHLTDADQMLLGHRTHAPALAKGLPLRKLMAELYGRTTGCSHARGGSMHVFDPEHGLPGSSAIVGGSIAVGVGAALSSKLSGSDFISVSYFGDAATNAGVFHESMNFAALKQLPVLFLCENNGLSNVMPVAEHAAYEIAGVASQFMPVFRADGTDALSVYREAGKAVRQVRETRAPVFLECTTKRWMKHQGHERDDLEINPIDPVTDCPIARLERFMIGASLITPREILALAKEIEAEIDDAIEFAERSPYPQPEFVEA
ncbi:MAG: thiamine pyrophosphate-dependent dehydrogenase E1 component subunit alpha [Planctomycetes bacterium]|nr:thiamine pyrophosphate-dependent dehydrogenase E1 component subunit alpha [Planctomycetota bacterium]